MRILYFWPLRNAHIQNKNRLIEEANDFVYVVGQKALTKFIHCCIFEQDVFTQQID